MKQVTLKLDIVTKYHRSTRLLILRKGNKYLDGTDHFLFPFLSIFVGKKDPLPILFLHSEGDNLIDPVKDHEYRFSVDGVGYKIPETGAEPFELSEGNTFSYTEKGYYHFKTVTATVTSIR